MNIYKQNQAFEHAYEKAKVINPDTSPHKWESRNYQHSNNPEKLKEFYPFVIYNVWFEELYNSSQTLTNKLNQIALIMESTKTTWLGLFFKKKKINECFNKLYNLNKDLSEFKTDCSEFLICILSADIKVSNGTELAAMLHEQIRYIDLLETRINQTGDRKLTSINNSRMQFLGLVLSITAIVISVYSMYN